MRFATTRWSLIFAARNPGKAHCALEEICQAYRAPVLAYVRRHGYSRSDAEDLTQEFFARFLEGRWDEGADPARGRFRAFLLVAIRRFLISADLAAHAAKRGGGACRTATEDELERLQAPDRESPEQVFQRTWAMTILDRSYARLQDEAGRAGRLGLFEQLSPYLSERPAADDYQRMSDEVGLRPNTIAVAVHRLRVRLRELVREELARTCASPEEVEEELHDLRETLKHIDD